MIAEPESGRRGVAIEIHVPSRLTVEGYARPRRFLDGPQFNEYAYISDDLQVHLAMEAIVGIPPSLNWSPVSTRLMTHRIDEHGIAEMSLWHGAAANVSLRDPEHSRPTGRCQSHAISQPGGGARLQTILIVDAYVGVITMPDQEQIKR